MTETQAAYHPDKLRDQEIIDALREVLNAGYGKVIIFIDKHQITEIEKSIKVRPVK